MADFWVGLDAPEPEIMILSRQFVNPSSPILRHALFLPYLDAFWRDTRYNRRLLFHEPGHVDRPCSSVICQQLQRSLSDCLVHYFPWCGRIAAGADPPNRLFIDCNDAGVEFVEAFIDMPISDLARDGFQMKPFFDKLCQNPDHKGDCLYSSPLLSIQATFFSDGGLALGVAHSHVVADGQSLWNFMISWAECSRGVRLSLPPLHDRQRLAVQVTSMEKASLWDFVVTVDEEAEAEMASEANPDAELGAELQSNGHVNGSCSEENGEPGAAPLVQCALQMSAAAVKKLKAEAGDGFSSYEVVCAHVWRHSTAARQLPKHSSTFMAVLADGRSRLTPPLPPAYFGNVISLNLIYSAAAKICSETLRATAGRIHGLVAEVQGNMENLMGYLEMHLGSLMDILRIFGPIRGKGHHVSSSPRFPAYAVDFGWGKPVAVRAAKTEGEGELVLFGGRPGSIPGEVEICTALPASVLKRLLDDPLFLAQLPCKQAKADN